MDVREVEKAAKRAMTTFSGMAGRGVVAGLAVEGEYAVIVVAPRDDLAVVHPAEGGVEANGKLGPEKPAKVVKGKIKGNTAHLLKDAESAAIGAAVASTGLGE